MARGPTCANVSERMQRSAGPIRLSDLREMVGFCVIYPTQNVTLRSHSHAVPSRVAGWTWKVGTRAPHGWQDLHVMDLQAVLPGRDFPAVLHGRYLQAVLPGRDLPALLHGRDLQAVQPGMEVALIYVR